MSDMGTRERAYELARSGLFRTVSDLETALSVGSGTRRRSGPQPPSERACETLVQH
jgi:hypothetical protein